MEIIKKKVFLIKFMVVFFRRKLILFIFQLFCSSNAIQLKILLNKCEKMLKSVSSIRGNSIKYGSLNLDFKYLILRYKKEKILKNYGGDSS